MAPEATNRDSTLNRTQEPISHHTFVQWLLFQVPIAPPLMTQPPSVTPWRLRQQVPPSSPNSHHTNSVKAGTITWTEIPATDMSRVQKFYSDVFGVSRVESDLDSGVIFRK